MKFLQYVLEDLFILFLVFCIIILPLSNRPINVLYAQNQSNCEKLVKDAEVFYKDGLFEQAIELLTECLNKDNISKDIKMEAYRLLGLTYLAIDYRNEARTAINKLLDLVPNYKIDPKDPPPLVTLIESERKKRESLEETKKEEIKIQTEQKEAEKKEEEGTSIWWYIGGGVLVVVAIIILLSGGSDNGPPPDDTEDNLPDPPDLP